MQGLDSFFHGVSGDFFNNAIQFIDFPPEDLEPSSEFGDAAFQIPASPSAGVPLSFPSGFHGDAPERKPTIPRSHDRSVSATKSSHFLSIVSENSIQDGKLEIPADFVNKYFPYADEISNRVVLEIPISEKWEVELVKSCGKVWLQNGWKEFAEYHSLKCGCSVVFRYDGNCKFHVLVFDTTCMEIEYSKPTTGGDDFSVDILSEPSSCCQLQEGSSSPCTRPSKIRKIDSQKTQMNSNSEIKRGKGIAGMKRRQTTVEKKQTLSNKEKANALQIAASFKSENPYFLTVVQPSFLRPTYRVTIPTHFSNVYLKTKSGKVNLSLNGKLWPAKWYSTEKYSDLRSGWRLFANDNNLEVGDVCAFEMIDDVNMSWKVVIHRRAKGATPSSSLGTNGPSTSVGKSEIEVPAIYIARPVPVIALSAGSLRPHPQARKESLTYIERARALERTKSFKSDNPFFVIIMQPAHVTKALFIPLAFAKKHLKASGHVILRIPDGRTWRVSYRKINATLGESWKAFVRDNNIQVGDACVFELIEGKDMVLNVVIFPTSDANHPSSTSGE